MEKKDLGKTSIGIEANIAALLAYLLGFVSGIILIFIEKENKFVRFHAMQSIITFGLLFVLNAILPMFSMVGFRLIPLVGLLGLALWIVLMIKSYQGEKFKLPVIGDIAEKNS